MHYLVLLLALFHSVRSAVLPQIRRDTFLSHGRARFNAIHVDGHKDIERRGTVETGETATFTSSGWYECTVGVGDQSFSLAFDSGSADLWIPAPVLESTIGDEHTFYEPSSSATLTSATWQQTYGAGSASGVVYTDTVTFGGITLQNQPVEVATSSSFDIAHFDGILGVSLGANGISPTGPPTFLSSVYNLLEGPVYTAKLTRPSENSGFYTFGYIDADTVGGQQIQWTPVVATEQGYWAFSSTIANVGGNAVSLPSDNIAIADTGTTLIYVSDPIIDEIYTLLGGNCDTTGLSVNPCIFPQNANIPSITLYVGGYGVTLGPDDIDSGVAADQYEGYVIGTVQPRSTSFDIFGDVWLRNVYAMFDFTNGNPQFGVVPRAPGT